MSKSTAAKSDRTRLRILGAAASAFREHGIAGVGLRDVMKRAGLTRGGFYFHFSDKDALLVEATKEAARSNAISHQNWAGAAAKGQKLQTFIAHYLSEEHRDSPESGCFLAALGVETGRSSPTHRKAFTEGIDLVAEGLSALLPGARASDRKLQAELLISSLAGVLTMSRALPDRARSNALLAAARQFYSTTFAEA